MESGTKLLELMHQGGWVMWALLVFSIVSVAVAIERAVVMRRAKTDVAVFLAKLERSLKQKGSMARALEICEATHGAVARVCEAGLRRFDRSAEQVEKHLERRAVVELRRLDRGLGLLATTATTAPLLGFLGTVTGMMASFHALMDYGMSNPAMVAQGIAEALTTTAAGLVVAVPVQIVHNYFAGRVEKMTADFETAAHFLLEVREEMA